jgi:RNA polymerase sigma-70 factor (ECF subfamily)
VRKEAEMKQVLVRDADLVEGLRRNDSEATEALIAAYGGRAYRLAISITGNRSDAEEVVQDAMWAIVRKIDTFRGDAAFGSWIYRVVANRAYEKRRAQRPRSQERSLDEVADVLDGHGASAEDWSADVEDPGVQADLRRVLTAAMDTLPEQYRTVVVLRDIEGLSVKEVSEIIGITAGNVKSRTHRARLVLRDRLAHYFSDRPLAVSA